MGLVTKDDGWRIRDELWSKMEPLLPEPKKHPSAYRRFREWTDAGVFEEFWKQGLLACDQMEGIDWSWIAIDGTMTKAPLAGSKNGSESDRSGETGCC